MKQLCIAIAVLGYVFVVAPVLGYAQGPTDIGKQEFHNSCASCHGEDGKGAGPVAGSLKQKVPDLTVLAKNNAGIFPFSRVYDVIDGRQTIASHGPRDMPVWGETYSLQPEGGIVLGYGGPKVLESFVRGRIIALIGYIYTLQAK